LRAAAPDRRQQSRSPTSIDAKTLQQHYLIAHTLTQQKDLVRLQWVTSGGSG